MVAIAGRDWIGYAWTVPVAGESDKWLIEEVAVVPDWQRRGLARRLVKESARWMTDQGCTEIWATALNSPEWLISVGFRRADGNLYVAAPGELG